MEITPQALSALLSVPSAAPTVVDVREAHELARVTFPGAVHIPLGQLHARALKELGTPQALVMVCHHGVRSLQAALMLRSLGFENVQSLRGGIDQWAVRVDPSLARY